MYYMYIFVLRRKIKQGKGMRSMYVGAGKKIAVLDMVARASLCWEGDL